MLFVVFTIKRKNTIIQNKTSDTTGKVGRSLIKNFSSNRRFRLLRFVIRFFSLFNNKKKQVKKNRLRDFLATHQDGTEYECTQSMANIAFFVYKKKSQFWVLHSASLMKLNVRKVLQ